MKSRVGDPIFILGAFLIPGNKDFGFRVYLPSTKFYPVGLLSQKLNRLLLLPQMERLIERLPWMNQDQDLASMQVFSLPLNEVQSG